MLKLFSPPTHPQILPGVKWPSQKDAFHSFSLAITLDCKNGYKQNYFACVQTRPHLSSLYNGICSGAISSWFSDIWQCDNTEKSLQALIACPCRFLGLWSLGGGRQRMSEILHSFRLHSSAATQPHTAVKLDIFTLPLINVDHITYVWSYTFCIRLTLPSWRQP